MGVLMCSCLSERRDKKADSKKKRVEGGGAEKADETKKDGETERKRETDTR